MACKIIEEVYYEEVQLDIKTDWSLLRLTFYLS